MRAPEKHRFALALLFPVFIFGSCKEKERPVPQKALDGTWTSAYRFSFEDEVYGDPDIFGTPRLQVLWRAPNDLRPAIWSFRASDGLDLRRAFPMDVLERYLGKNVLRYERPVRSPDCRYVAASVERRDNGGWASPRILLDLKEKRVIPIKEDTIVGRSHFLWTADSKTLFFYARDLYQYDVETATVTKPEKIYSSGLYLIDDDKHFLAVRKSAFDILDRNGKLLRRIRISRKNRETNTLSPGGKFLLYFAEGRSFLVRTAALDKPVFEREGSLWNAAVSPDGKWIYAFEGGALVRISTADGKTRRLMRLPGGGGYHVTWVQCPASKNGQP